MSRGVIKNEKEGYQKRLPNSNKNNNKNIYTKREGTGDTRWRDKEYRKTLDLLKKKK